MPPYHSSAFINQLSYDRYGTDVPTLWNEVESLKRRLRHRSEDVLRMQQEVHEQKRKYEKMRASYKFLSEAYDRALFALKEEKRKWRRVAW